jgi:AraC-like DNA-binding protein
MTKPLGRPDAIVRPKAGEQAFEVERIAPSSDLAEFVDYYWLVKWKVREPYRQQIVPQPCVHIAAEEGRVLVHGVTRDQFFRTLIGTGHALGAAFHAGGFRPVLKRSVGTISGAVQTGEDALGIDDRATAAQILAESDGSQMIDALEAYIRQTDPHPDPVSRDVTALVAEAEKRSDIVRAEQLADHAAMSLRNLQRLFTEYLGIGPKWVIQRFRILDAAAAAHSGQSTNWSDLAQDLGFSDQAHMTRVFSQVVGTPPATYRRDPGTT